MFKKLNINFLELNYDTLKDKCVFQTSTFKQFSILDTSYIFKMLEKQVQFNILPEVNITEITYPGPSPHTDAWPTAINFYFETGTDETIFWKKTDCTETSQSSVVINYNQRRLTKTDSFVANKGDCYLLDVGTSIHSVKIHTPTTARKILRLVWRDLSFNEALHNLKIL